jgi:hypothetical protein
LARYHVDDINVVPWGRPPTQVMAYFTAALGVPPEDFKGTYIWPRVQQLLQRETTLKAG